MILICEKDGPEHQTKLFGNLMTQQLFWKCDLSYNLLLLLSACFWRHSTSVYAQPVLLFAIFFPISSSPFSLCPPPGCTILVLVVLLPTFFFWSMFIQQRCCCFVVHLHTFFTVCHILQGITIQAVVILNILHQFTSVYSANGSVYNCLLW